MKNRLIRTQNILFMLQNFELNYSFNFEICFSIKYFSNSSIKIQSKTHKLNLILHITIKNMDALNCVAYKKKKKKNTKMEIN